MDDRSTPITSEHFASNCPIQAGRDIELCNSFELDYNVIDGAVVIDRDYYNTKEEQFKQVIW